jgi:DNA-binding PadR family transcriptional regulator
MSFRLKETDRRTLVCVADHRILTVAQLAAIFQKSRHVIRKRLRDYEKQGLVEAIGREYGQGRGRPESSFALTEQGVDLLREKTSIDPAVPYDKVVADGLFGTDHQLLLNWFRIHLAQIERVLPRLTVTFLAHNSPCLPPGPNGPVSIGDCSPVPSRGIQEVRFTPDAVFATCDSIERKTCLFFLEVDCGTETLASPRRDVTDLRQKIVNYQWYFRSGRYKRFETVFHCSLRGFRLLFLTNSPGRLTALCQLVQEMPPSNFIWLTEGGRLFTDGVSAKIWAKSGDLRGQQESILGSLCCRAPLVYRDDSRLDSVSE